MLKRTYTDLRTRSDGIFCAFKIFSLASPFFLARPKICTRPIRGSVGKQQARRQDRFEGLMLNLQNRIVKYMFGGGYDFEPFVGEVGSERGIIEMLCI